MTIKMISLTDILAIAALVLFVGACSYSGESGDKIQSIDELAVGEEEEALRDVDVLPLFDGCEDQTCSNDKLIQFIYTNLKYPKQARKDGVEGKVYVQFVVEKDGSISNAEVVKDIGGGCGDAALAVVNSMNSLKTPWTAGVQDGKQARVKFTLPFSYKLES